MRILFAIHKLTYSGAPKMMTWIANQMVQRGHEVFMVAFFSGEQARILHPDIMFQSLDVQQSSSRLVRNTTGMLKTLRRLDKYVKSVKPDVLVSFLDSVGYMYLPMARKRCKVVVSERVDPYAYKGRTAAVRFKLMQYAHKAVFQTEGAREFFKESSHIYEHSTVIPNPVVVSDSVKLLQKRIPTHNERDNRIVTVGRLSLKQKRQDVLLEAFQKVYERHPEMQLVIYGDGEDKDAIQSMIDEKGLSHCVTLAGRTDRVEEDIFNARVFVLTSDFEGIPNALIEALSIGVPSVSTDCSPGGAALLIRDGESGYLVPRGDVQGLYERICTLIEEAHMADKFSKVSQCVCEDFSEEVISQKWENVFVSL